MGECPVTDFELLHIAKPSVRALFPDGEHAVKEIVEPFASGKVVGVMGQSKERLGVCARTRMDKPISLLRLLSCIISRPAASPFSMAQHR